MIGRVYKDIKKRNANKKFFQNAVIEQDFKCGFNAQCVNEGEKKQIKIGKEVTINGTLIVNGNGKITIGNNVTIRHSSVVASVDNIYIGNYVIISNNVKIMDNNSHPISPMFRKNMSIAGPETELWSALYSESKPVCIKDNVWIGERVTILKGVTIGKGSIVACDAVVVKDVPAFCIVAGNPAKVVKQIDNDLLDIE